VIDNVADLPSQVVKELGITVIPLNVRFGEKVYRDGLDLTAERFYQELTSSKVMPVTSVPSPLTFIIVYDKLAEEADEILAIMLFSRLSATHEVAVQSIGLMKQKCRVDCGLLPVAVMGDK
jgi:DegV family protein with EDD domain